MARSTNFLALAALVAALSSSVSADNMATHLEERGSHCSDWFKPSPVKWRTCPDSSMFQCGYLEVPMNYQNEHDPDRVNIALRMLPATVPKSQQLGHLFFNPGGPGESGTASLFNYGPGISAITLGLYNVVSWDPRGVNMTTPPLNCQRSPKEYFDVEVDLLETGFSLDARGGTFYPSKTRNLSKYKKTTQAYFEKLQRFQQSIRDDCAKHGNKKLLASVSSTTTARDLKVLMEAVGDKKLNFWAISYGTVIGNIFTALYPELVNRVVLDGVVNPSLRDNQLLAGTLQQIQDAQSVYVDGFLGECVKVNASVCPLNDPQLYGGKKPTPQLIGQAIQNVAIQLAGTPQPLQGKTTASAVVDVLSTFLYFAFLWQDGAGTFAAAIAGSNEYIDSLEGIPPAFNSTSFYNNSFHRFLVQGEQDTSMTSSGSAIQCLDSPLPSMSLSQIQDYVFESENTAINGGPDNTATTICSRWPFKASERYNGPWSLKDGRPKPAAPILIVANKKDSYTAIAGAQAVAQQFGSSARLLTQDGYGHTSFSQSSNCIAGNIGQYFITGKLPAANTVCPSNGNPYFG